MNINIKATNTTLTPTIKRFIEDKLSTLEAFLKPEDVIRAELEIDKKHRSGLLFRAEIDIQPRGRYADARAEDFYIAFDMVIEKIKEQLVKQKGKRLSLRRKLKKRI